MLESRSMKILSVLLIIIYLTLPALCFGHPCELFAAQAEQSSLAPDVSDESPLDCDADNCETTCCCAGHIPLSTFPKIPYLEQTSQLLCLETHLALPRLIDRIYVPPQNLT